MPKRDHDTDDAGDLGRLYAKMAKLREKIGWLAQVDRADPPPPADSFTTPTVSVVFGELSGFVALVLFKETGFSLGRCSRWSGPTKTPTFWCWRFTCTFVMADDPI